MKVPNIKPGSDKVVNKQDGDYLVGESWIPKSGAEPIRKSNIPHLVIYNLKKGDTLIKTIT